MVQRTNNHWNIERFLDSFIIELDKAQDTLAIKGINRKLTYTVKDVALDLHVFPSFQEGKVLFTNAKPGETGASKMSIQLGSITDAQIAQHASEPLRADDISIDELEEIDDETKREMRKIGVNSVKDINRMEDRNIKMEKVLSPAGHDNKKARAKYDRLAKIIQQARRRQNAPQVRGVSLALAADNPVLLLSGDNLVVQRQAGYPAAFINNQPVKITDSDARTIAMQVNSALFHKGGNSVQVALDPFAVINLEVDA